MANNNGFSSLFGRLAAVKSDGTDVAKLLSPLKAASPITGVSSKILRPSAEGDLKTESLSAADSVKSGISFGAPSINKTSTQAGTNEWANLLEKTASGGIASAFGSGLLSAIGGIGGLVSSIAGLFGGGKRTEAPLTLFEQPVSQKQTLSIASTPTGIAQGSGKAGGVYAGSAPILAGPTPYGPVYQDQSAQITQAVKQALLNSSSLNDVIADI